VSRWPNKYVIGLTGNIGVGKSVVRQMLQHSGAYTIDADSLAHQVMMPNAPAYKPILNTFGQFIVGPDGRINRQMLGQMVFSNPDALKKLEDITHPIIRQGINALVSRSTQRVVVIEAIKLIEGGLADLVDAVWVVDVKPQIQYKRLIEKRKMSEADAKQRILAQGPQGEKLKRANVVIDNNGNVEDTWKQVQKQWADIRQQLTGGAAKPATGDSKAAPTGTTKPVEAVDTMDAESQTIDVAGVTVKRGNPNSAQAIADFIKDVAGRSLTRIEVMENFGQKNYVVAQDANGKMVGLMGYSVENLVTRVDEFYCGKNLSVDSIVHALVVAMEESSKSLSSEVAFFFAPAETPPPVLRAYQSDGYQPITLKDIKVPAWREAVEEAVSQKPIQVLWKQLRKDRVLQPI
jgi:dephospho-CoA kinase